MAARCVQQIAAVWTAAPKLSLLYVHKPVAPYTATGVDLAESRDANVRQTERQSTWGRNPSSSCVRCVPLSIMDEAPLLFPPPLVPLPGPGLQRAGRYHTPRLSSSLRFPPRLMFQPGATQALPPHYTEDEQEEHKPYATTTQISFDSLKVFVMAGESSRGYETRREVCSIEREVFSFSSAEEIR